MKDVFLQCGKCCMSTATVTNDIKHKVEFKTENGQSIFLTYYDCPCCGARWFVQIDDKTSMQMLEHVKIEFVKLAKRKAKGKKVSEKRYKSFCDERDALTAARNKLKLMYANKTVREVNSDWYGEVNFSV